MFLCMWYNSNDQATVFIYVLYMYTVLQESASITVLHSIIDIVMSNDPIVNQVRIRGFLHFLFYNNM